MRLLIVNGPNLNLIGQREPEMYGKHSFLSYFEDLKVQKKVELDYFQSNIEGELIDCLQGSTHDGIILNAGGYTHTSVSIGDCVKAIHVPVIEVHITNISGRESFRHTSMITPNAIGCILGFGLDSYALAVDYFLDYLNKR